MEITENTRSFRTDLINRVARLTGYTSIYVRMVLKGQRNNKHILNVYTRLEAAVDEAEKFAVNLNVKAV